jgi:hypothetical protein
MNTVVLGAAPCEANALRAQLRHSWLANQILNKSATDVAFLRKQGSWPALDSEFDMRLEEAQRLAGMIEPGFSPALLVDILPMFASWESSARSNLKQAVHLAYVVAFKPGNLLPPYQTAVEDLKTAVNAFRRAWGMPIDRGDAPVTETWSRVLGCARTLEKILDSLPKGIVLP